MREEINQWLATQFKNSINIMKKIKEHFRFIYPVSNIRSPILRHIRVGNHQHFKKTIDFPINPEGFSLIIGSNISGKSTLIDLLKLSLTGRFRKKLEKLRIKEGSKLNLSLIYQYNDSFYENNLIYKRDRVDLELNFIENYDSNNIALLQRGSMLQKSKISKKRSLKSEILQKYYKMFFGIEEKQYFDDILNITIFHEKRPNLLMCESNSIMDTCRLRSRFFNEIGGFSILNRYSEIIDTCKKEVMKEINRCKYEMKLSQNKLEKIHDLKDIKINMKDLLKLKEAKKDLKGELREANEKYNELYKTIEEKSNPLKIKKDKLTISIEANQSQSIEQQKLKYKIMEEKIKLEKELEFKNYKLKAITCPNCVNLIEDRFYNNICLICGKNRTQYKNLKFDIKARIAELDDNLKLTYEKLIDLENIIKKLKEEKVEIIKEEEKLEPIEKEIGELRLKKYNMENEVNEKRKQIDIVNAQLIETGKYDPQEVGKLDKEIKILEEKIIILEKDIKDWDHIYKKLFEYKKEIRSDFINEFNKFFNKIIKRIMKKKSKITFNLDGTLVIENNQDFEEEFSGAEIRIYEIAFRISLFRFLKKNAFNFPLIIENCEKDLDDTYKDRLAKTLIWFNELTKIPIILTSYEKNFYKHLLLELEDNKQFILNLNDYVIDDTLLSEQKLEQKSLLGFLEK